MVRILRRVGITAATPADPGYEALEWQRRQVLFPDWTPATSGQHDENVEIYSNAEEVELFLNSKSLGKKPTRKDGAAINWQVPYQAGTLKAVATHNRKEVATDTVRTAGKPVKIILIPDRKSLGTTFDDVANVEIQLVDENGTLVPTAADLLQFTVSGPGRILGLDSGNVMSTEPFQATERKAYQGRALAILRATAAGKITLTAKAEGLPPASVELTAP